MKSDMRITVINKYYDANPIFCQEIVHNQVKKKSYHFNHPNLHLRHNSIKIKHESK